MNQCQPAKTDSHGTPTLEEIVGGHDTALGTTPNSRYVGESTRKSGFVNRRAVQLGL
jgi:hypothetical protein